MNNCIGSDVSKVLLAPPPPHTHTPFFKTNGAKNRRPASFGITSGTAAALGALAGCGGGGNNGDRGGTFDENTATLTGDAANDVPRGDDTITGGAGDQMIGGDAGNDTPPRMLDELVVLSLILGDFPQKCSQNRDGMRMSPRCVRERRIAESPGGQK